jgi:rare lipoprotein A (peptidoglycan hydrolase)
MKYGRMLSCFSLGAALLLSACHSKTAPSRTAKDAERTGKEKVVLATWYDVPPKSLAERRAGNSDFTAASDHYKIGTLLRVTRLSNSRSVVVRVTDTGLKRTRSRIDVCRGAAEKLDMIEDGVAKVTIEVLP